MNLKLPRWRELPDIDLYLEQVLSLLDSYLLEKLPGKKKSVLTKTMINNYVKQKVIEPPVNKKYNKRTVAALFLLACLKNVYPIADIARLISIALRDDDIETAYDRFCEHMEYYVQHVFEDHEGPDEKGNLEYLMANVANSFACQLFVNKEHLNK